jgi:hypothetical protein
MTRSTIGAAAMAMCVVVACVGGETGSGGPAETDGGSGTSSGSGSSSGGGTSSTSSGSSACPSGRVACAGVCCAVGNICVQTISTGNEMCAPSCTRSSECTSPTACCEMLKGGGGACLGYETGVTCLCEANSDCTSAIGGPACAPYVENGVVAAQAFVCKSNDAAPWDGCDQGAGCCPSGFDCWVDSSHRAYCTPSCNADTACGNAGVACCTSFGAPTATCDNCVASCSGAGGCTVCP